MTITLNCHRISAEGAWECSFHTESRSAETQKATTFIGHPGDRRAVLVRRSWKVTLPESASLQDDGVIWFGEEGFRILSANEVFEFAQKRLHGFSCVEG